jgi:metal-dependent hydrolase (beta-lactamase superfamily II)
VLVTVTKAGREHRFLFDAGTSPDGVVENMRRLGVDPGSSSPAAVTPAWSTSPATPSA